MMSFRDISNPTKTSDYTSILLAALLTDVLEFIELAILFERDESSKTLIGRMFLDTHPEILPSYPVPI